MAAREPSPRTPSIAEMSWPSRFDLNLPPLRYWLPVAFAQLTDPFGSWADVEPAGSLFCRQEPSDVPMVIVRLPSPAVIDVERSPVNTVLLFVPSHEPEFGLPQK